MRRAVQGTAPFLRVLVGLFAVLITLTGCEEDPPREEAFSKPLYRWGKVRDQSVTIRGNTTDLNRPHLLRAFERYRQLTGNTVILQEYTHQELEKNLPAAFLDGREEKPDLLLSFGGVNIEKLNPETNFYDFTHASWVEDLTDTALNQAIYNGKVYGFPFGEASVSGTLYNKDLFRSLGIAVPRTQAEFLEACERLLRQGVTPVYLPYAESTMLLYQFPLDCIVRNDRTLDALNEGRLTYSRIPEMRKIVEWYKTMAERGYFGPHYTENGWNGMDAALRSEEYAMMLGWDTWLYTNFTGDASKFGLMPAFMGVPENGSFEGPNLSLLLVNKRSPRLDAALDLIDFMADPYNYNVALEGLYTAPIFKNQIGSLSTPQYMEAERLIERLFHDSRAWMRIRGFSQLDAVYIKRHMRDPAYTVEDCLRDMDEARLKRAAAR